MLDHAVAWDEEVGHGGCEVEESFGAEGLHEHGEGAEFVEVVRYRDEGEEKEEVVFLRVMVFPQDGTHFVLVFYAHDYRAVGRVGGAVDGVVIEAVAVRGGWGGGGRRPLVHEV